MNILIQMPTDFFYDEDISQSPHKAREGRGMEGEDRKDFGVGVVTSVPRPWVGQDNGQITGPAVP